MTKCLQTRSPFYLFDKLFDFSDSSFNQSNHYPPYNIYVTQDGELVFSFALAGFEKDEIGIEIQDGILKVSGKHEENLNNNTRIIKKGIADRSFEIRHYIPKECGQEPKADFVNGVLKISFKITKNPAKQISIN